MGPVLLHKSFSILLGKTRGKLQKQTKSLGNRTSLPGGIFFLIHGRRSRHSTDRSEASRKLRLKSQAPKTTVQKWLSTRKHGTFRLLPFHQASAFPYRWHNRVRFGNCSLGARFWHLSAVLQLIAYLFTKKRL